MLEIKHPWPLAALPFRAREPITLTMDWLSGLWLCLVELILRMLDV